MADEERRLEELLSGLLDGELSDDERREALSLVNRDPEARALYERMQSLSTAFRDEEPPAAPAELAGKIASRVRATSGEVVRVERRRWLGPAALTAAASVAAALLIGALLHDQWEVFAPPLEYGEDRAQATAVEESTDAAAESFAAESARDDARDTEEDRVVSPAPGEDSSNGGELEAATRKLLEMGPGVEDAKLPLETEREAPGTPVTTESTPAEVPAQKSAPANEDTRQEPAAPPRQSLGYAAKEKAHRGAEDVESESKGRARKKDAPADTRAVAAFAPEREAPLTCASMWISSTRLVLLEDAPQDAAQRFDALVAELGGRRGGEEGAAVVIPVSRLATFIEKLGATGHAFVGPEPTAPSDRECITLSFSGSN